MLTNEHDTVLYNIQKDEYSALMCASAAGNIKTAEVLLQRGAKVDLTNNVCEQEYIIKREGECPTLYATVQTRCG